MSITREDIDSAKSILRRWVTEAKGQRNKIKEDEVKHVKRVLDALTK